MPADLMRIADDGSLHPDGGLARDRMRVRAGLGAFQLMPAPAQVLFLRCIGEEVDGAGGAAAAVRLAGEVTAPGAVCDIVAMVSHAGWRGELLVLSGEGSRSLFFEAGNILGAQTNVRAERIGPLLQRLGILSGDQIAEVEGGLSSGRRFGEIAVAAGFLTEERLFEAMSRQTREIAFAGLQAATGVFYFLDGFEPSRLPMCHQLSASAVIMEAARRMDESKYFRERIPSEQHVPTPAPGRPEPDDDLKPIWQACDGRRSVLEVARLCERDEFEVTKALFQLVQAGFLYVRRPRAAGPAATVSVFNEAMVIITRAAAKIGRSAAVTQDLERFARSTPAYQALFAGAGPLPDGSVDPGRVVANVEAMADRAPDGLLAKRLHMYAAFALFLVSLHLPRSQQRELTDEVAERIKALAPSP
jgi:hypothetical protein